MTAVPGVPVHDVLTPIVDDGAMDTAINEHDR